ncbi:hypothetical protein [Paracraurococcus ruber]|uniref:hypothetical protein n=1 Tax=Paracraurococcus ruber TaxID=77675 RepID=UPI0010579D45|nr:hypothetical protein [Paracraurococcus ruber]TDG17384.1 hypothetical protein E2C05_28585 [Paracraurococcus ruber]
MLFPTWDDAKEEITKFFKIARAFIILAVAPFTMRPLDFDPNFPDSKKIFRGLGFTIPSIPAFLYVWATWPFFRTDPAPIREYLALKGTSLASSEDYFVYYCYLFIVDYWDFISFNLMAAVFSGIIYTTSTGSYILHSVLCFLLNCFHSPAQNAPFEFYLVRTAGSFTWFGMLALVITMPLHAEQDSGLLKWAGLYITQYPVLYLFAFCITGLGWHLTNGREYVGIQQMYPDRHQRQILAVIRFGLFGMGAAYIYFFPGIFAC